MAVCEYERQKFGRACFDTEVWLCSPIEKGQKSRSAMSKGGGRRREKEKERKGREDSRQAEKQQG